MPECPFPIQYDDAVLEQIRYAIVDAFFSVPRGGLEIGGILLGGFDGQTLRIAGHQPLDCEHATGPSFALSERDHAVLSEQLAAKREQGLIPVGWYHSHTRSEIFLSEADLEIHRRYFPESWQIALVLRPASMRPTRAAFFFRQADGTIRSDASYQEFVVEPLPAGAPAPVEEEPAKARAAVPPPAVPVDLPVPHFLSGSAPAPKRRVRAWIWILAALLLSSTGGACIYFKDSWIPKLMPDRQVPLTLQVLDMDGQMQIMWNPQSSAVRNARGGTLDIVDGPDRNSIVLDAAQLRGGTFNYARKLEIVHLRLTVRDADGTRTETSTSFLGRPPSRAPSSRDVDLQSANEALTQQLQDVTGQLKKEQARGRWMEKVIIDLRRENDALKSHP